MDVILNQFPPCLPAVNRYINQFSLTDVSVKFVLIFLMLACVECFLGAKECLWGVFVGRHFVHLSLMSFNGDQTLILKQSY